MLWKSNKTLPHNKGMLKSLGVISVEPHKGRIVVNVSDDLINLYYWFISTRYWIRMNKPLHGAHITVYNKTLHRNTKPNWVDALKLQGEKIEFQYDEYIVEGGYTKGFLMYYLRVYSQELEQMKKKLGIVDGDRGFLHLTICNGKSNAVFPDWPKMISLNTKLQ